jgi:CrcB protein
MTVKELALLAVAGAAGTLCRYAMGGLVHRWCSERFPWGTFVVNASGCLLFGVVWALAEERLVIRGSTRFIVLTGFMGAYTTFSTFAFETAEFMRQSQWWLAAGNAFGQLFVGVAFVLVGIILGRVI